jgi:uncharacterized membrane protein
MGIFYGFLIFAGLLLFTEHPAPPYGLWSLVMIAGLIRWSANNRLLLIRYGEVLTPVRPELVEGCILRQAQDERTSNIIEPKQ